MSSQLIGLFRLVYVVSIEAAAAVLEYVWDVVKSSLRQIPSQTHGLLLDRRRRISIRKRMVLLPIALLSLAFIARAADHHIKPSAHRLEYIHYDTVTLSVEWGVSEGTINEAGDFTPGDLPLAIYSINLQTGVMTHNGQDGVLSPGNSSDANRIFHVLSEMMATYTQNWEGGKDLGPQDSNGDGSVERGGKNQRLLALRRHERKAGPRSHPSAEEGKQGKAPSARSILTTRLSSQQSGVR